MESAYGDFAPDPSFGTHFFQNLTSFQTGYFCLSQLSVVFRQWQVWNWMRRKPIPAQRVAVRWTGTKKSS